MAHIATGSRFEVSKKKARKAEQHFPQKPFALFGKEPGYELPERHPMYVPFPSRSSSCGPSLQIRADAQTSHQAALRAVSVAATKDRQ
jgi:hypothetical protein